LTDIESPMMNHDTQIAHGNGSLSQAYCLYL
jgi:hypothetical protein